MHIDKQKTHLQENRQTDKYTESQKRKNTPVQKQYFLHKKCFAKKNVKIHSKNIQM